MLVFKKKKNLKLRHLLYNAWHNLGDAYHFYSDLAKTAKETGWSNGLREADRTTYSASERILMASTRH